MTERDPIKTYDARWEEEEFSDKEIRRFFESLLIYAEQLDIDSLTITRDARLGAGKVMQQAIELAISAGFNVYACMDPISTPMSYYFTMETTTYHPGTMGLTITASHNPREYIGLKVTVPPVQAIGLDSGPLGGFSRIREIYHSSEKLKTSHRGNLTVTNPSEKYIAFSMSEAGVKESSLEGITVVLNSFNGSAGPEIFRSLQIAGAKIIPLQLVPDGYFPAGAPNPISRGKMDGAIAEAAKAGGAIVIGTDGDGDRLVFGDSNGVLDAGFSFLPILETLIRKQDAARGEGRIIYDPKISPLALYQWSRIAGKTPVRPFPFRNGHSQIKEYMRRIDALAAVEESGHFYHVLESNNIRLYAENSIFTILLFLKAVKNQPEMMERLWKFQKSIFTTGEFNFKFPNDRERDRALGIISKYFEDEEKAKVATHTKEKIDLGGIVVSIGLDFNEKVPKITGKWFSGYFRSSTNEKSILRAFITAADSETGGRLERKVAEICRDLDGVEAE